MAKFKKNTMIFLSPIIMLPFLGSTSSLAMEDVVDEVTHSYMKLKKNHKKADNFRFDSIKTKSNSLFESFTSLVNSKVTNVVNSFDFLKYKFTNSNLFSFESMKKKENFIGSNYFFNYAYSKGFEDKNAYFNVSSNNKQKSFSPKKADVLDIDELHKSLDQIDEMLKNQGVSPFVTVIIGNTGVGKTTIFQGVQGLPLFAYYQENRKEHLIKGEEEGISSGYQSETRLPRISKKRDFFDCPGFGDNRGITQDIINAYSLYKVFNQVKEFNLLVVVEMSELFTDRAGPFIELIGHIEKLFPYEQDTEDLKKGLNLVITKVTKDQSDIKFIKNIMLEIQERSDLSPFKREILSFLSDENNNQITFFEKPQKSGKVKINNNFIKGGSYIKGLTPSISITDKTEIHIKDLADKVADDISVFLTGFKQELPVHTNSIIRASTKPAKDIRNSFKEISGELKAVTSKPDDFENDTLHIRNVFERLDEKSWEKFSVLMERREFFRRIKPESTSINFSLDQRTLRTIIEELALLSEDVKIRSSSKKGKIKMIGHIVGTSDIQKQVEENSLSKLETWGLSSLIIDDNIIAPGVSIALTSPIWTVIGEKKIDLKGKDEVSSIFKASPGENGKSGKPGQSGGKFYGLVNEIYNSGNLTIDVSGGNGGKGQDGGNGKDGEDGKQEDVKNRLEKNLLLPIEPLENNKVRKKYRSGELGGTGGDTGLGGDSGKKGSIFFQTVEGKEIFQAVKKHAVEGIPGQHGIPGKGGKNGKIFEGIYIEELPSGESESLAWEMTKDTAIGATIGSTVPIVGTAAGIVVGATIAPTKRGIKYIYNYFSPSSYWEVPPHELPWTEFSPDGKIPNIVNQEKSKESESINLEKMRNYWQAFINNKKNY